MKKSKEMKYFHFILLVLTLSACTPSPDFEMYEGKSLRIAVVGEPPEVKEEQVHFKEISFDEMTSEELKSYDAVFIMRENLPQAAESYYADIYLNSPNPFFFIQSTKSYNSFIDKEQEYADALDISQYGGYYATGFLASLKDENHKFWRYGLYNDIENNENIKDVYSRIFNTIEQNSHP
ncbi:hypothetical protein [Paenisporosarcina antarctica]|uniref:Lipoprotein n=1 Tax=Paenisporosarcina antarctica TaxID=417367 RepID=A0A4P6ZUT7_9BACL|nr:hypothetical protein [Paenisporosarcina antarctica]QBP39864.1 hypothetical protein E2636_01250 [Paenisporosarcina antarctica]